jgi:hypothetical protein
MKYFIKYKKSINMIGGEIKDYCNTFKNIISKDYKYVEEYSSDISTRGCIFKVSKNNIDFEIIKIMTNDDYIAFYTIYKKIMNEFSKEYFNSIHPKIIKYEKIENGKYWKLHMEYFGEIINHENLEYAKTWLNDTLKLWHSKGIVHGDILEETSHFEASTGRYKINRNNILFNGNEYRLIDFDSRFDINKEMDLRKKIFDEKHAPSRPTKKPRIKKLRIKNKSYKPKDDHEILFNSDDEDFLWQ